MKIRRKMIPVLALCILLFVAAGTSAVYAYYSSSHSVKNQLITQGSGVVLQEYFNRGDKWLPGETKTKEVWFGNEGDRPQVLRFKADSRWTDSAGVAFTPDLSEDIPWAEKLNWTAALVGNDGNAATVDAGQEWTKIGDYYYYNKLLLPGSADNITTTAPVLTGVTFNENLSNGAQYGTDYSDKIYNLDITMETLDVDVNVTKAAWSAAYTVNGSTLTWTTTT